MAGIKNLLEKSGYSPRAIEYYIKKINVGGMDKPSVRFAYSGPCGDTMEIFLAKMTGPGLL